MDDNELRYRPLEVDLQIPAAGYGDPANPQDVILGAPVLPSSPSLLPLGVQPTKLTDGAAKFGQLIVPYEADAGAGNFSNTAKLTTDSLPLGFVWYLGAIDSTGVVVDQGAGLVNRGKTYATLNTEIYSGVAGCAWTASTLSVYVKSANTGFANLVLGYFYYVYYYDDLSVKTKGL